MPVGNSNTVIPGCGAHHIAIQTTDFEESMRFYRDVLGMSVALEFEAGGRKIVLLDMGDGSHIELFEPQSEDAAATEGAPLPVKHFALATTDAGAAIERVRAAGYPITVEPREANLSGVQVTFAFFKGPAGEIVEFFQTH